MEDFKTRFKELALSAHNAAFDCGEWQSEEADGCTYDQTLERADTADKALLDFVTAALDGIAGNAARYGWLRANALMTYPSAEGSSNKDAYLVVTGYGWQDNPAVVDEAVDVAMAAQNKGRAV